MGCELKNGFEDMPACNKGPKDAQDHATDKFMEMEFQDFNMMEISDKILEICGKDSVIHVIQVSTPISRELTCAVAEIRMELLSGKQIADLVDYCRDKKVDLNLKLGYHEYRANWA